MLKAQGRGGAGAQGHGGVAETGPTGEATRVPASLRPSALLPVYSEFPIRPVRGPDLR